MRRCRPILVLGFACAAGVIIAATGQSGGRAGGPPVQPAAPGQAAAAQSAAPLKPGPAVIVGKVVEAGSATGVAGAVVTLNGQALGPSTAMFSNGLPGGPRRISTNPQGQFLFRDLPAGAYFISSQAAGYVDGLYGQTPFIRKPLDLVRALSITEADKPIAVTIQMWKLAGVSGRVIDEAGEPMVGASVSVLARVAEWGNPITQSATRTTTDDRGMYHADVAPGDYLVGLLAATTTVPVSAVDGFLQAQREGGAAMQAYMSEVRASGALLPRGVGARVGNFMVSQFGFLNAWAVPPLVSEDGRQSFYPTTFHPSSLTSASASLVTLASGEEKTGIDVVVRRIPARRISGRVVGPNGPVAAIALRLSSDSSVTSAESVTPDTPQTLTDAAGAFTFVGVAPGSYTVRVLRTPASASEPVLWAADPIAVATDADLMDLQVRLQTGATIGGRVVVEGTAPLLAADGLRAITIRSMSVPGTPAALMGVQLSWVVRPDENSRFTTRQVIPGPHMIVVTALPSGWVLKSVTAGGQNAVDKAFEVPLSGVDDMVVTITNRISTLTGVARDANGQSAPMATVAIFPADKSLWPPPGIASRRIQTVAPDRDGRYAFRGLPSGEYCVVATEWPADFSDGKVLTTFVSAASRVTITEGGHATQDLRVIARR